MDEWFLEEFGPYGFTVSHTVYDPNTFTPSKKVIHPRGFMTSINLSSEIVNDVSGWSVPSKEWVIEELKIVIREHLLSTYPEVFKLKDFKPNQYLRQFKF